MRSHLKTSSRSAVPRWAILAALSLPLLLEACRGQSRGEQLNLCIEAALQKTAIASFKPRDVRIKLLKLQARTECEAQIPE